MLDVASEFIAQYWLVLLSAFIVLQTVSVGLAVLSERREPAATLAWLLTVTFLPIVGIVAYYALARCRFRRQFHAKTEVNFQADEALSMCVHERLGGFDETALRGLPPVERSLIALAVNSSQSTNGAPPFPNNAVKLYFSGAQKYKALHDAIQTARHHVHLEYYIFRADAVGTALRDLLVERAQAGVEVRVLCDGVGSLSILQTDFFEPLKQAGGEVASYLPPRLGRVIDRVNFRNHRKIVVVDGQVAFLGGMNIGDEYLAGDEELGMWHDAHLRVAGPAVAELQRLFLTDWLFATEACPVEPEHFPETEATGDALVQIVASGPDCRWPTIQQMYFQAITAASEQVLIATPYFVPDPSTRAALTTAALRGVDVRVMLPAKSDVWFVTSAARSYYEHLLEAGVRILEYHGGFIHAKTLAVDGRYASVGSANMDVRSFTLNFEVSAFVYSRELAQALGTHFEADSLACEEIELEAFQARPRLKKLGQSIAQLLSAVL
jgi:cardiolipin synthase A/B